MHSNPMTEKLEDDSDGFYKDGRGKGIDGHLLEQCLTSEVSIIESQNNYKVISVPSGTQTITSVISITTKADLTTETFFDTSTYKVYVLSPLAPKESVRVCFSPLASNELYGRGGGLVAGEDEDLEGGFGLDADGNVIGPSQVQNIEGFDMSRILEAVSNENIVTAASRSGRLLVPFGRWIIFAIRLWVYLKIPTIIGPLAGRGPAWESGQLADTIVDYYSQTVSGAFNIWGTFPDLNPGESAMRMVLKASFKLYFAGGLTQNEDFLKISDGLIRLSVLTFWFGAFLQKIPPPGAVQNVISPVVFPGLPLVTPPTPNMDSAQMAMEFAFMFTIHSLTIGGFEIGLVPAGPALIPVPYPFVALI